jgi:hypothetical protein
MHINIFGIYQQGEYNLKEDVQKFMEKFTNYENEEVAEPKNMQELFHDQYFINDNLDICITLGTHEECL